MDEPGTCAASSLGWRFGYTARNLPARLRGSLARWLLRCVVRLVGDSNLLAYARRELPPANGDDMQQEMNSGILQLLTVFAMQGHSGFSASYATGVLEKLMRYEPLGPLTGAADEWFDHGGGVFQNLRCSHVFKQPDRFNGQAYDLDGRVFREPNGATYTNWDSMVPITFPYTPKREYVDVPASSD